MKRMQFTLSSLLAGALVFGSLGISGFVGAVSTMARDNPRSSAPAAPKVVVPENDIDALNPVQVAESPVAAEANVTARLIKKTAADTADRGFAKQKLGVRLSKDGLLTGRLNLADSVTGAHVAAETLTVKFVQRGSVITEVKPGPGGVFQADGLTPGVFSLIASGPDGFFASGLTIYPYIEAPQGAPAASIQDALQIDATVVHPANVSLVKKLIRDRSGSPRADAQRRAEVMQAGSRRAIGDVAPLHTPVLTVGSDGHVLTRINDLDGATRERSLAVGATVFLIQRGAVRGQYKVAQDGSFYAPGIVAGQYTLLALSQRSRLSFAAIGVIVEDGSRTSGTVNLKSSRLNVLQAKRSALQAGDGGDIDMIPVEDFQSTAEPAAADGNDPAAGFGGGGFGGGGGGVFGGGGGGGFGALGALGLGGGIAGLAAALSHRNNNNDNPKSPAAP
jgi:hypothetical protein